MPSWNVWKAVIRARLDEALQQPAHSSDSALDVRSAAQRLNLSEIWCGA